MERLNRYLARAGVASRRLADQMIASGVVLVNGERPPPSGLLVDADTDVITVNGQAVRPVIVHRYLALHKPVGVITTARDEADRTTVLDLVGEEGSMGHRLFPVGRLDADSSGLLLLTDDGDLAFRLTHPRYKVTKEYVAVVAGTPSLDDLQRLRHGVELEDGPTAAAEVEVLRPVDDHHVEVRVMIREGRNRQVRRMLEAVGHRVQELRRVGFGPLKLGRLKPGGWRVLVPGEVAALRRAVGVEPEPRP